MILYINLILPKILIPQGLIFLRRSKVLYLMTALHSGSPIKTIPGRSHHRSYVIFCLNMHRNIQNYIWTPIMPGGCSPHLRAAPTNQATGFRPVFLKKRHFTKVFYQKCNIHFAIMLSLSFNNKFIGIIFLYRSSEKKDFTEKDLFILDILKKHLSLKIYNCEFSNENNCNSEAAIFTKPRQLKTLYDKYSLTPREQEITSLLLNGLPISEIADMLIISESTLRTHFTNIYRKLNISRRSELIKVFSDADCSDMTE